MMRSCSRLVAAVALFGVARVEAQEPVQTEHFTSLGTYSFSLPVGDTRKYVSNPGWLGFGWEGQWPIAAGARGGVALAIHDFSKSSSGTTNFPSGSATGEQFRDLLSLSVMATGRWYSNAKSRRGPYLGFGAGGSYAQQSYQLGVMPQLVRTAWHMVMAPEVGVAIPVYEVVDAVVSVRYMAPVSGGRYIGGGSRSFQFIALNFGFSER